MSKNCRRAILHLLLAGLIAGAAIVPSNALAEAEPKVLGKTIGECVGKVVAMGLSNPPLNKPYVGRRL
jgi:hypothetical protein